QRRAVEHARLQLPDHDVLRLRRDLGDDGVAVEIGARGLRALGGAAGLPRPGAAVPVVLALRAGAVEHGQALRTRRAEEPADRLDSVPGLLAAGVAPALDRLEDRLGPVA